MIANQENAKSKRKDLFEDDPLPMGYYHPSPPRHLSSRQKQILLSPDHRYEMVRDQQKKLTSDPDDQFLTGSNRITSRAMPTSELSPQSNTSKFDESWPESERPSSLSIPEVEQFYRPQELWMPSSSKPSGHKMTQGDDVLVDMIPERDHQGGSYPVRTEVKPERLKVKQTESTLSKYIERFRYAEPMSREDRAKQKAASSKDFWWISESSHSDLKTSTSRSELTASILSDPKPTKQPHKVSMVMREEDEKTRMLQERADALLEKSSSSLNSSDPIVSTDGLGSSESNVSYEEPVVRPVYKKFIRGKENIPRFNLSDATEHAQSTSYPVSRSKGQKPEDDILYQWRLKRKLETARAAAKQKVAGSVYHKSSQDHHVNIDADMDSALTRFRERLKGQDGKDAARKQASSIQFTPVPTAPAANQQQSEVTYKKTPITSSKIKTQLLTEQTSQHAPLISASTASSSTYHDHVADRDKIPVCSPYVQKQADENTAPPPHLHLMCDILSCPHHQSTNHVTGNQFLRDEDESVKEAVSESQLLDKRLSKPENFRDKHDEYPSSVSKETTGNKEMTRRDENDKCADYEDDEKRDVPVRDDSNSEKVKHEGLDHVTPTQSSSGRPDMSAQEHVPPKEAVPKPHSQPPEQIHSESSDLEDSRSNKRLGQTQTQTKSKPHAKISKRSDSGNHVAQSRLTTAVPSVGRKGRRAPIPMSASSPKPAASKLKSAVSQVVSDRLFGPNQESPLSSYDESLPKSQDLRFTSAEDAESSDDDFKEDELLKYLRQQRARYEAQLHQIDSLLQEIT